MEQHRPCAANAPGCIAESGGPSRSFDLSLCLLACGFVAAFALIVVPPLLASGDVLSGIAHGFVNPYATGYALDAIGCWCVLAAWVLHDRARLRVRHGWVALVLGVVPGAVVGLAFYLLLRQRARGPVPVASRCPACPLAFGY
jgi:hypothetical protein